MGSRSPDISSRKYLRAARSRLRAAEFLVSRDMNLEAVYLAGYAVECAMKALIVARTPRRLQFGLAFHGRGGHDYGNLKKLSQQHGIIIPKVILEALVETSSWSTDMRYETEVIHAAEATK